MNHFTVVGVNELLFRIFALDFQETGCVKSVPKAHILNLKDFKESDLLS